MLRRDGGATRRSFHTTMLVVKTPQTYWGRDEATYSGLMASLSESELQLFAGTSQSQVVRFTRCERASLPRAARRRLSFTPTCPTEALVFSVDMLCAAAQGSFEPLFQELIHYQDSSEIDAVLDIARAVHDLTLAANLAAPGAFLLVDGIIRRERTVLRMLDRRMNYNNFLPRLPDCVWPAYLTLEFERCWRWLLNNAGFQRRYGGGAIGRALNALTHIAVGQEDRATELMWAMVGLEALFCRERRNLAKQIRAGLQLIGLTDEENLVRTMYDIRSRFVHGSLDFNGVHPLPHRYSSYTDDHHALIVATEYAKAALLVSIQHLIRNSWDEIALSHRLASA